MLEVQPHFIKAAWPFTCSECLEEFPGDSLMMIYHERLAPRVSGTGVKADTKHLCEACGKLLMESL